MRSPLVDLTARHKNVCIGYRTAAPNSVDCHRRVTARLNTRRQTNIGITIFRVPVAHLHGQNMEVPPMVWADMPRIVLCFVAIILCEKLWKWIQGIQIKVDKPKHEVSLPELVTNLVSIHEKGKPEEENKKYVDALEQTEITRPKILTVSPRDPKMDATAKAAGMKQCPDDWDSAPTASPNMDTAAAPPSYASTNGRGMPIVYDHEGLSKAQQITLKNLH